MAEMFRPIRAQQLNDQQSVCKHFSCPQHWVPLHAFLHKLERVERRFLVEVIELFYAFLYGHCCSLCRGEGFQLTVVLGSGSLLFWDAPCFCLPARFCGNLKTLNKICHTPGHHRPTSDLDFAEKKVGRFFKNKHLILIHLLFKVSTYKFQLQSFTKYSSAKREAFSKGR